MARRRRPRGMDHRIAPGDDGRGAFGGEPEQGGKEARDQADEEGAAQIRPLG